MLLKEKDLKIQRNIYDYRFAPKFNIFKSVSGILDCFVDDLQLLPGSYISTICLIL